MPIKAKHDVIARQWGLLKLLPSRSPGRTAKELADALGLDGFRVSKRTVERDLINLSRLFPIMCNDKGMPYGWYWAEGARLDLPSLSVTEALSLTLIAQYLRPLVPASLLRTLEPRFQLAASKLAATTAANPASRWTDKVASVPPTLALLPPKVDADVLETVQDALLADEQLDVAYRSAGKTAASEMRLHPLGLVQRGPVSYLVAGAFKYDNARLFALHRFQKAQRVNEAVRRPKGFSLDRYIASGALDFGGGGQLVLEAIVSKQLAGHLTETPLAKNMKLNDQGTEIRLSATVTDSPQLRWWILSHGAAIHVLKPDALQTEIARALQTAAGRYGIAAQNEENIN